MFNKIKSLIWLRANILLVNKNMVVLIIMPYFLGICYKKFMDVPESEFLSILFVCLAMSFTFSTGNIITSFISEEKEKNNLKTLMLSGVRSLEYIISTLFFPASFGILSIFLLPIVTGSYSLLKEQYLTYLIISLLTLLAVILLNLLIAMFSETQSKAQINSLPIMFATTFLPMFAETNDTLNKINQISFMGGFTSFFNNIETSTLVSKGVTIVLVWIACLLVLNILAFNSNKKNRKNIGRILKEKIYLAK